MLNDGPVTDTTTTASPLIIPGFNALAYRLNPNEGEAPASRSVRSELGSGTTRCVADRRRSAGPRCAAGRDRLTAICPILFRVDRDDSRGHDACIPGLNRCRVRRGPHVDEITPITGGPPARRSGRSSRPRPAVPPGGRCRRLPAPADRPAPARAKPTMAPAARTTPANARITIAVLQGASHPPRDCPVRESRA